jgi:uncharacterized iron-regulated membrane protein
MNENVAGYWILRAIFGGVCVHLSRKVNFTYTFATTQGENFFWHDVTQFQDIWFFCLYVVEQWL